MADDLLIYEQELRPWLPATIVDIHAHVGLPCHHGPISAERLARDWALEVGVEESWGDLWSAYGRLLPANTVVPLAFGSVFKEVNVPANNAYVLQGAQQSTRKAFALCVTRPEWSATEVAATIDRGFLGIKPYPDLAPYDHLEVSIFDFLPREHLRVLNEREGMLMLHLPRANRLRDPDNIAEVLEIHAQFPNVPIVLAHVGRCFCLPTAQAGLPAFADTDGVFFDISANLNPDVFQLALETLGPGRILFGSDLPITLMRGMREHVGEKYINYSDGLYSWNTNRKSPQDEADYTFFLYQELRALAEAVRRCGGGRDMAEQVMFRNGARLLGLTN